MKTAGINEFCCVLEASEEVDEGAGSSGLLVGVVVSVVLGGSEVAGVEGVLGKAGEDVGGVGKRIKCITTLYSTILTSDSFHSTLAAC